MTAARPIVILLVEDNPAHAEIVRRNLGDLHVASRLCHVEDGQAALDYLFRRNGYADPQSSPRPQLIMLDLRLPKVDGLEVLGQLKGNDELMRIPTVVLTTSAVESDLAGAYAQGAASYLVKPLGFEQFTQLMAAFGLYWLAYNRFPA